MVMAAQVCEYTIQHCGVNRNSHSEFPAWPWPICISWQNLRLIQGRDGESWPFSPLLFLVHNCSSAHQSLGTSPWSSSRKGWAVKVHVCHSSRDAAGAGQQGQARDWDVSNKILPPDLPFLIFLRFQRSHRALPRAGNPLTSRAASTQLYSLKGLILRWELFFNNFFLKTPYQFYTKSSRKLKRRE